MAENTPEADKPEMDPVAELAAATKVAGIFQSLTEGARSRLLQWLTARFDANALQRVPNLLARKAPTVVPEFETLAELIAAVNPANEPDRALVTAYWVQTHDKVAEFDAYTINKELTHLGYKVGNITNALSALMNRKPALVVQLRKSGSSKQARKSYKLTTSGQQAVNQMLGDKPSGE